jgi:putative ABC transport system permease protein
LRVDENYLDVYGIKLVAGKGFLKADAADSIIPVILNEAAVRNFGWIDPETAIGKPFRMGGQQGVVKGVVNDFHFSSLQDMIQPLAIYPLETRFSRITLKIDHANATKAIASIQKTWKKYFPAALLDYDFLDKQLGEQYANEERFSRMFLYFSILSLLIACLGLYGLISFAAVQRTKEIGIRKVLGATVNGITYLLSKSFLKLVGLAFLVATPIAWWIMNSWLQDFAYRTRLSPWMFAIAGLLVTVIAFITISFRAIKAAITNPVKSLRTE